MSGAARETQAPPRTGEGKKSPLSVELEPYPGEPESSVAVDLRADRVVFSMTATRHMKLDDAVEQAALLVALAEAGGLDNVFGRFQNELMKAREHVRARAGKAETAR